ncbi:protein of unknown function [Marinomonas polaris DSM 16579]|uniref:Protein NO VEIN C-terminal domain-containing protein n=1 Tax=Marinomonas polaris DSM 16579 TaxID=1122206 RepID=A0A1M5CZV6_9GAMM|nr:DUF3883 domain-containing protein [Marinomonas polaris]SHF60353.1 protein of unknown function [Marinomonas polaris DSM 16579]
MSIKTSDLMKFEPMYSSEQEDKAHKFRGAFLKDFPLDNLESMEIDDYVIGHGTNSFCAQVEAKTITWANIQGSTSFKFGIYFGRTKYDPKKVYRFSKKFNNTGNSEEAYRNVKNELLRLIEAGKKKDFHEIDANKTSQMFKAKILSLYFPESFINMCSAEHLQLVAKELGYADDCYISEIQNILVREKNNNEITKDWSNPRFMQFLYAKYIKKTLVGSPSSKPDKKKRKPSDQSVDFEKLNQIRAEKGKKSEAFALEWEKTRLIGANLGDLQEKVKDLTNKPSFGYDFQSYSAKKVKRYIEVKTISRWKGGYHFFLSDNERFRSESEELRDNYYFYLVEYDKHNEPKDVHAKLAKDFYGECELNPIAYKVEFDLDEVN